MRRFDVQSPARGAERERLARARRSQNRREKGRLDLRDHAKLSQWLHDLAGVQDIRPVGQSPRKIGSAWTGAGGAGGASTRRRGRLRRRPGRQRNDGWLVACRHLAEQADLRIRGWLGQSILLNALGNATPKRRLI